MKCCKSVCLQLMALTSVQSLTGKFGLFVCVVFFARLMFLCFRSQTQLIDLSLLLPGFPSIFVECWWFQRKRKLTPEARYCGRSLISLRWITCSVVKVTVFASLTSATVPWESIERYVATGTDTHRRAMSIGCFASIRKSVLIRIDSICSRRPMLLSLAATPSCVKAHAYRRAHQYRPTGLHICLE